MLVVIQVSSVTSLVSRVTGEETAPSHAPVLMVHIVTLLMESAPAELLTAVSVTRVGLALTVQRPVVMTPGDQTVRMLVCVSTVECVIRYLLVSCVFIVYDLVCIVSVLYALCTEGSLCRASNEN